MTKKNTLSRVSVYSGLIRRIQKKYDSKDKIVEFGINKLRLDGGKSGELEEDVYLDVIASTYSLDKRIDIDTNRGTPKRDILKNFLNGYEELLQEYKSNKRNFSEREGSPILDLGHLISINFSFVRKFYSLRKKTLKELVKE